MKFPSEQLVERVLIAGLGVMVWRQHRLCRKAEAKIERLLSAGDVDLEPVVAATEDLVAGLRLTGKRRRRSADVAVVRALP